MMTGKISLVTKAPTDVGERDATEDLAAALARATLALGRTGRRVEASLLAAAGYAAVRRELPAAARRLDAVMHALARPPQTRRPRPMRSPRCPRPPSRFAASRGPRRHELIFDIFAALSAGDAFELVNDHDPKPLYYQLEAEQTGRFSWEYVDQGPEVWRARIGRTAA